MDFIPVEWTIVVVGVLIVGAGVAIWWLDRRR